jgi:cbb3-type cytochrome oxidase subunit 1
MALRAMGGALVVISFILFAYNIIATIIKRQPVSEPNLEQLQPIPAE